MIFGHLENDHLKLAWTTNESADALLSLSPFSTKLVKESLCIVVPPYYVAWLNRSRPVCHSRRPTGVNCWTFLCPHAVLLILNEDEMTCENSAELFVPIYWLLATNYEGPSLVVIVEKEQIPSQHWWLFYLEKVSFSVLNLGEASS